MRKNIKISPQSKARRQREERQWTALIDAIIAGRVIPVIGPDFLTEDDNNGVITFADHHQQLIDVLASACEVDGNFNTFSQLIHNKDFRETTNDDNDAVYDYLADVIDQLKDQGMLRPNHLLMKLLESRLFPFVITTSFSPIVEMVMQEIWPDQNIRVLQYRNDSSRDLKIGIGDIASEKDLEIPTVYYMFGKYSHEPHRYVVTDFDMMDFCKAWLTEGNKVPRVLFEALKKRYLLVLGNNYSDWLFRFIWYAIRNTPDMMKSSLVLNNSLEPSLENFLEQVQTFIERDPQHVIDEIERRVLERRKELHEEEKEMSSVLSSDVFISYSRSDSELAMRLASALRKKELKVWLDVNDIPGAEDWKNCYVKAIRETRIFIPLLTHNIEKEYIRPHEYRDEWKAAASFASQMGNRKYIWPLTEKGFDFYNQYTKLPVEFIEKNATWFTIADSFDDFASDVKVEVDLLKNNEKILGNGY